MMPSPSRSFFHNLFENLSAGINANKSCWIFDLADSKHRSFAFSKGFIDTSQAEIPPPNYAYRIGRNIELVDITEKIFGIIFFIFFTEKILANLASTDHDSWMGDRTYRRVCPSRKMYIASWWYYLPFFFLFCWWLDRRQVLVAVLTTEHKDLIAKGHTTMIVATFVQVAPFFQILEADIKPKYSISGLIWVNAARDEDKIAHFLA